MDKYSINTVAARLTRVTRDKQTCRQTQTLPPYDSASFFPLPPFSNFVHGGAIRFGGDKNGSSRFMAAASFVTGSLLDRLECCEAGGVRLVLQRFVMRVEGAWDWDGMGFLQTGFFFVSYLTNSYLDGTFFQRRRR